MDEETRTQLVVGFTAEGDEADLDGIERLHRLENLELQAPVRNIQRISELGTLRRLDMWDCRDLVGWDFLDGLDELTDLRLNLVRTGALAQVARLGSLKSLSLERWSSLTDLRPLTALPYLEDLSITGVDLTDLSPLGEFPNLTALRLERLPDLDDLSPLAAIPRLTELTLCDLDGIQDLTALAALPALETLTIDALHGLDGQLDDLGPSGFMGVGFDELTLFPLTHLRELTSLVLADLDSTIDFRPLNKLPKLRRVTVRGVLVTSVEAVRNVQRDGGWQWTSTEDEHEETWSRP